MRGYVSMGNTSQVHSNFILLGKFHQPSDNMQADRLIQNLKIQQEASLLDESQQKSSCN